MRRINNDNLNMIPSEYPNQFEELAEKMISDTIRCFLDATKDGDKASEYAYMHDEEVNEFYRNLLGKYVDWERRIERELRKRSAERKNN